jgi:predicted CopG family antitoxin
MDNSTIAINNDIKEMIKEFGNKGETYSEIILKLIKSARERQLQDILMDEENTIPIDEALENAKKRWQR